ncbi:MAG: FxsA family protein [Succinivibrio sp.]|nr:FxsA family protein [Succinivibrio sp.]
MLELVVLIEVGSAIGALSAVTLLFLGMLVGFTLVKMRFASVLKALQEGRENDLSLIFLPLAGFLFIFPGFISDVLGILLLIPACQGYVLRALKSTSLYSQTSFTRFGASRTQTQGTPAEHFEENAKVVDVEYTEVDEDKRKPQ